MIDFNEDYNKLYKKLHKEIPTMMHIIAHQFNVKNPGDPQLYPDGFILSLKPFYNSQAKIKAEIMPNLTVVFTLIIKSVIKIPITDSENVEKSVKPYFDAFHVNFQKWIQEES